MSDPKKNAPPQDGPPQDATITKTDADFKVGLGTRSLDSAELMVVPDELFRVLGEHARGGLGVVLRAHDCRLDRTVAVKQQLDLSDSARKRFVREMRITARRRSHRPARASVEVTTRTGNNAWPTSRDASSEVR